MHIIVNINSDKSYCNSKVSTRMVFYYTKFTQIGRLVNRVARMCGDKKPLAEVFIDYGDTKRRLVKSVRLQKLVSFLGQNELNVCYPCGIGETFDEENGYVYFVHSNESAHTPHVHVSYSGQEVTVNLISLEITGKLKGAASKKKIKEYVELHRSELLAFYKVHTNGIYVEPILLPST